MDGRKLIMNKEMYSIYNKYMFMIGNDDIFDGVKAHSEYKEWVKNNNISSEVIAEFEKQLEEDNKDSKGIAIELPVLTDIEYITLKAMMGTIGSLWIRTYMLQNNLDNITLQNGLIIKKLREDYYVVEFETEENGRDSIGLDLFLIMNKQRENGTLPKWLGGEKK
jgi:DNA repair exonuclease SbcCD ATPase subunit